AGTGQRAQGADVGMARDTPLFAPSQMAVDAAGNLVIFESGLWRLRMVTPTGEVTTMARTSPLGRPGNADAGRLCNLQDVGGMAFDRDGGLLIANTYGPICRLAPDGTGWAVAGSGLLPTGFLGDGGPALMARLGAAMGLAVDASGNVFVADAGNS